MEDHSLDKLKVFQKAVVISDSAWEIIKLIPKPFIYSTGDQFLRSADSVAANIAEGSGKYTFRDKRKYFHNARGSLIESRFWFMQICKRFDIPADIKKSMNNEIKDIGFLLNKFIRYLNSNIEKP
jgi:four helix bundle protein